MIETVFGLVLMVLGIGVMDADAPTGTVPRKLLVFIGGLAMIAIGADVVLSS